MLTRLSVGLVAMVVLAISGGCTGVNPSISITGEHNTIVIGQERQGGAVVDTALKVPFVGK